ncbi:hypothetical protein [Streptomyces hydrogenans]|uniref:hypothetical protein n=1 Tax=Streptomyces hydrogenans TaxID=1873719 RepID=UPI00381EE01C
MTCRECQRRVTGQGARFAPADAYLHISGQNAEGINQVHNDGKDDIAVPYDYGQQTDQSHRAAWWRFTSTGPDFNNLYRIWDSIYDALQPGTPIYR